MQFNRETLVRRDHLRSCLWESLALDLPTTAHWHFGLILCRLVLVYSMHNVLSLLSLVFQANTNQGSKPKSLLSFQGSPLVKKVSS